MTAHGQITTHESLKELKKYQKRLINSFTFHQNILINLSYEIKYVEMMIKEVRDERKQSTP